MGLKSVLLMYFSTAFKGVLTSLNAIKIEFLKYFKILLKCIKNFRAFCKTQNRSKTVFKYLINRSKNRIKKVSKTYFDLL